MLNKLKILEEHFFEMYPNGFDDEALKVMVKRHKADKLKEFTKCSFSKDMFAIPLQICEDAKKVISRSSLIFLFEKPKFKDAINSMSLEQKEIFSIGLYIKLKLDMRF